VNVDGVVEVVMEVLVSVSVSVPLVVVVVVVVVSVIEVEVRVRDMVSVVLVDVVVVVVVEATMISRPSLVVSVGTVTREVTVLVVVPVGTVIVVNPAVTRIVLVQVDVLSELKAVQKEYPLLAVMRLAMEIIPDCVQKPGIRGRGGPP
jgi:hypothetical protein